MEDKSWKNDELENFEEAFTKAKRVRIWRKTSEIVQWRKHEWDAMASTQKFTLI